MLLACTLHLLQVCTSAAAAATAAATLPFLQLLLPWLLLLLG
jgi:hypothetical protein